MSTQQSIFVNLIMQIRTKWLILLKYFFFTNIVKNTVSSFLLVNPHKLLISLYPNAQWHLSAQSTVMLSFTTVREFIHTLVALTWKLVRHIH